MVDCVIVNNSDDMTWPWYHYTISYVYCSLCALMQRYNAFQRYNTPIFLNPRWVPTSARSSWCPSPRGPSWRPTSTRTTSSPSTSSRRSSKGPTSSRRWASASSAEWEDKILERFVWRVCLEIRASALWWVDHSYDPRVQGCSPLKNLLDEMNRLYFLLD